MPVEGGSSFVKKDSNGSVQLGSRPDGHNLEVKKDGKYNKFISTRLL